MRLWPKFISSGWSVSRVLLCTGCDEALWPQAGRWHKADISQAPDAGKTLSLSSSQRLLHIFKPKHGHFSPPIWYRLLIYQQGKQHYARLEAKLWNKTFYFAGFVRKGWEGGAPQSINWWNFCTIPISTCKAYSPVDKMLRAKQGALYVSKGQSMISYFVRTY